MAGYFITGTDTDVGKTVVTSLMVSYFKNIGVDVFPYKPIQSGGVLENGALVSPDVQMYKRALPQLDLAQACTYVLKKASSPHLAAEEENVRFDLGSIHRHVASLRRDHEMVLVEGAGGVIVPIQEDYCMIDLMKDLQLPVILVGRAGLGTINHTVLSIKALKTAAIPIEGVILNSIHSEDETIEKDNIQVIQRLTGVPVLGIVPPLHDLEIAFQEPSTTQSLFAPLHKKENLTR